VTDTAGRICRVLIRGRVQGVGYRAWTAEAAEARALEGFVRNRRDGSVEVVFAGAPAVVEKMLEACHRGPPGARVTHIERTEASDELLGQRRPGERFSVLPTT
jgi:acylphosphatase